MSRLLRIQNITILMNFLRYAEHVTLTRSSKAKIKKFFKLLNMKYKAKITSKYLF